MHSHSSFMKETLVYRLGALNVTYNYGNAAIIYNNKNSCTFALTTSKCFGKHLPWNLFNAYKIEILGLGFLPNELMQF